MGKGKRQRKQINYSHADADFTHYEDDQMEVMDDDSEFAASQGEEGIFWIHNYIL